LREKKAPKKNLSLTPGPPREIWAAKLFGVPVIRGGKDEPNVQGKGIARGGGYNEQVLKAKEKSSRK